MLLCSKFGVRRGGSGRFDDWSVHADAATVASSCEGSLRRLGVDVIDLYYLHHRSGVTPIEETVTAMAELGHGGEDPCDRAFQFEAAGDAVQLWTLPDAAHINAINEVPADYERRVIGYLDAALLDAGSGDDRIALRPR